MFYYCNDAGLPEFPCATNVTDPSGESVELCIPNLIFCDGVPDCPDLSDEDLNLCSQYFPSNAMDTSCEAADIYNHKTIYIRPMRCNGIPECKDGSDEENCNVENDIIDATIVVVLVFLCVISALAVASVDVNTKEKCKTAILTEKLVTSMEVKTLPDIQPLIVVSQGTELQKSINYAVFQHLKRFHENDFSLILKELKVNLIILSKYWSAHYFFERRSRSPSKN